MKTPSLLYATYNVIKNFRIYVPCSGPPPEFWHRLHIGLICHQRGKAVESQAMAEESVAATTHHSEKGLKC